MTTEAYDIGSVVRMAVNIQVESEDVDPDALTFHLLEPDGEETEYVYGTDAELARSDEGDFYVEWTVRVPGRHFWRFTGTGNAAGATSGEFWGRRQNAGA